MPTITIERETLEQFRDSVLNQRGPLAENGMTSDQINDVLGLFDDTLGAALAAPPDPAAVPLTDDHIAELWVDILSDTPASGIHETEGLSWARLARAIERAHGIAAGDKP